MKTNQNTRLFDKEIVVVRIAIYAIKGVVNSFEALFDAFQFSANSLQEWYESLDPKIKSFFLKHARIRLAMSVDINGVKMNNAVKLHRIDRMKLSRKSGWRIEPRTLIVDRRSRFGNWIRVQAGKGKSPDPDLGYGSFAPTNKKAVRRYRHWLFEKKQDQLRNEFIELVKRKQILHIACWCDLDEFCHGDVWLEVWNGYCNEHK